MRFVSFVQLVAALLATQCLTLPLDIAGAAKREVAEYAEIRFEKNDIGSIE